jgi:hypothetical protein
MPKRDQEGSDRRKSEHEKEEGRDRERESREHERHERREREREGSGDDPRAHARIIERRWQGSPPPTAERYANALKQWQALPGAVPRPATGVAAPDTSKRAGSTPPAADEGDEGSKR